MYDYYVSEVSKLRRCVEELLMYVGEEEKLPLVAAIVTEFPMKDFMNKSRRRTLAACYYTKSDYAVEVNRAADAMLNILTAVNKTHK